jgi:hypothetical protein
MPSARACMCGSEARSRISFSTVFRSSTRQGCVGLRISPSVLNMPLSTFSAIILSIHFGIQREDCCDILPVRYALLSPSQVALNSIACASNACASPCAQIIDSIFDASGAAGIVSSACCVSLPTDSPI